MAYEGSMPFDSTIPQEAPPAPLPDSGDSTSGDTPVNIDDIISPIRPVTPEPTSPSKSLSKRKLVALDVIDWPDFVSSEASNSPQPQQHPPLVRQNAYAGDLLKAEESKQRLENASPEKKQKLYLPPPNPLEAPSSQKEITEEEFLQFQKVWMQKQKAEREQRLAQANINATKRIREYDEAKQRAKIESIRQKHFYEAQIKAQAEYESKLKQSSMSAATEASPLVAPGGAPVLPNLAIPVMKKIGNREEVVMGKALMTKGGLRAKDLTIKVVSVRASATAKASGRFARKPDQGPSKREIARQKSAEKKRLAAEKKAAEKAEKLRKEQEMYAAAGADIQFIQ